MKVSGIISEYNPFHLGHKYLLFFCERDQVLCQPESDKQGRCHAFERRTSSVTWRGRTSVHKGRVQRKQESVFLSVQYQFRSHLQLYRETWLPSQSAAGIFYQLDGFAKLIYLPDATQLDSIVEAPLYSGFGKWRSTAYCFLAKAVGSYQYVVNKGKHTKHCGF